jgi:acetoin utilization protein AcuC
MGLCVGEALARYGFPEGHPLGADRQGAFLREARARGLERQVQVLPPAAPASRDVLERFHTAAYVDRVRSAEADGLDYLDDGDTPVFPGVYDSAAVVVGTAVDGLERIMRGEVLRTFQPIGGLHHAGRGHAAGFCVFSDIGVVIETLRLRHGVHRVAYVDIDVHHGDGVFYAFEDDPDLIVADIHEDGHNLYPGTGHAHEIGRGRAEGAKLNIPLPPGAGDSAFSAAWARVVAHLDRFRPEFILFQAGADGLQGDPLAHLAYTPAVHTLAARSLRLLADRHAQGRLMAFGGGGYDRGNLAAAWSNVVAELLV